MIRKGQFPCIRHGKYVRISMADLQVWTDRHREKGFDGAIYSLYNAPNGRKRAAEDPKIALSHSRADGGSNRRPAKHGRPLGARRIEDFRTRVQTDPSAGEDGIEREKE